MYPSTDVVIPATTLLIRSHLLLVEISHLPQTSRAAGTHRCGEAAVGTQHDQVLRVVDQGCLGRPQVGDRNAVFRGDAIGDQRAVARLRIALHAEERARALVG